MTQAPFFDPADSSPISTDRVRSTRLAIEVDITQEQQAVDAVERTVAELGRLDTLVNNAGVMLLGPAVGAPLAEWPATGPGSTR